MSHLAELVASAKAAVTRHQMLLRWTTSAWNTWVKKGI